ncbi:hypothetical protein PSPO01_10426 [Paraphaeosphaeria sporulosa]
MRVQCKRRSQIANRCIGGRHLSGDGYAIHPSNVYPNREAAVAFLCHKEWPYSAGEHGISPTKDAKNAHGVSLDLEVLCRAVHSISVLWLHTSQTQKHLWITLRSSCKPFQRHGMRIPCYVTESASHRQSVSLRSSTVPSCSQDPCTNPSFMTCLPIVSIRRQAVLPHAVSRTCRSCS